MEICSAIAFTLYAIKRYKVKNRFNTLENVLGTSSLNWVKENNKEAEKRIGDPKKSEMYDRLLNIFNSKEKIASVEKIGNYYYNFWKDETHVQGLLRRTTLESYKTDDPNWESVLDFDDLSKKDNETWVYKGKKVLYAGRDSPLNGKHCLISLSRGGADAAEIREFNLVEKKFVNKDNGGFFVKECKSRVYWRDYDTLFVGTNVGEDPLTDSGYPRTVRIWKRNTPLEESKLVYEGEKSDVSITGYFSQSHGYEYEVHHRAVTFYEYEYHVREVTKGNQQEKFMKLKIPKKCSASLYGNQLLLEPKEDWKISNTLTISKGSLVSVTYREFVKDDVSSLTVLFVPTRSTSLQGYTLTLNFLCLSCLDHVKSKRIFFRYNDTSRNNKSSWSRINRQEDALSTDRLDCWSHDSDEDDLIWTSRTGFITPSTISLLDGNALSTTAETKLKPIVIKKSPSFFDEKGLKVTQHFCDSVDGTQVPYFQISRTNMKLDGSNPTLLYAYGGFEISMLPYYSATRGVGWFEDGGVWIVANIRGGGEYSDWHQSALLENRYKAYEDFESVARDLITRRVTSSKRLGIMGGSNGGLLVGNAMTRYPELYEAAICMVPLLDMKRYTKLLAGASWAAEFGDPDDDDVWNGFLRNHSPFHRLVDLPKKKYPHTLFTTSTRDDRVHPAHARKMVKRLIELGHADTTYYYENIEGGHGGAANNPQTAYLWTLVFMFLRKKLLLNSSDS